MPDPTAQLAHGIEGSVPLTPGRSLLLIRIEQLQGTVLLLTKGPLVTSYME